MRTRMILFSMLLLNSVSGSGQEREGAQGVVGGALIDKEAASALGVVMDYDQAPRPVKITRPTYPKAAFKKGIEGTVNLEIVIDREGRVSKTRVLQSVPGLDEAALECVYAWTFKPAMKDGVAVATVAHAPITFSRSVKPKGRK